MIEFDRFYFIPEEDVEAIIMEVSEVKTHPYKLIIRVKSGRDYVVNYKEKEIRDLDAKQFAKQVELSSHGKERTLEAIFNRLYLMDDRLRRVDKRGLRIWQQLKALLKVEVEVED